MSVMFREYLTTFLRNLLAPVIAYLAATGYITSDEATNFVVALIAVVISVGWGLINKYLWKEATKDALQHPPTSSDKTLKDVIAGK